MPELILTSRIFPGKNLAEMITAGNDAPCKYCKVDPGIISQKQSQVTSFRCAVVVIVGVQKLSC